jgi:hypothetical protein
VVIIRLKAGASGFSLPAEADGSGLTWKYAFVFWLDGAGRDLPYETVTLAVATPDGSFERLPLVPGPTAANPSAPTTTAYAESTTPQWDDANPGHPTHFGHCTQEWGFTSDYTAVRVKVFKTMQYPEFNPQHTDRPARLENLGIVAWLTNGSTCEVVRATS